MQSELYEMLIVLKCWTWHLRHDYCTLLREYIREHLHSTVWYMRDCSEDNSIPDMMCNEIRYLDVTSVTSSARAMETFTISLDTLVGRNWLRHRVNRVSIYRVLSLVPDSNLSDGSRRERRGRAREIAARKSPSHPVCIFLHEQTHRSHLFFSSPHVCYSHSRRK